MESLLNMSSYSTPYFQPEVTEDENFYYLKIHPDEREIAKGIRYRSWDGELRRWIYPKKESVFLELSEKLKKSSKLFNANPPSNEIIKEKEINKKEKDQKLTFDFEDKFNKISESLNKLNITVSSQSEKIDSIIKNKDSNILALKKTSINQSENIKNEKLDDVFNRYLNQILNDGNSTKENLKNKKIKNNIDINQITDFVLETHEKVFIELRKLDKSNEHKSYLRCVEDARIKQEYFNEREGTIDIYQSLLLMMNCRNALGHPKNNNKTRKKFLGIIYALLFSETWMKIYQE